MFTETHQLLSEVHTATSELHLLFFSIFNLQKWFDKQWKSETECQKWMCLIISTYKVYPKQWWNAGHLEIPVELAQQQLERLLVDQHLADSDHSVKLLATPQLEFVNHLNRLIPRALHRLHWHFPMTPFEE